MPPQQANNNVDAIMKKLQAKGAAKAFDAHKSDETDFGGGGSLPAGIEGGLAQLTDAALGLYKPGTKNAGEPYFRFGAVVLAPKVFEGQVTAGVQISKIVSLCDTGTGTAYPKSFDENFAKLLNELRKMGVDTKTITFNQLPQIGQALKQQKTVFAFRTWKMEVSKDNPNPMVQLDFKGKFDGDVPTGDSEVTDNTGSGDTGSDEGTTAAGGDEESRIRDLAAQADDGVTEAIQELAAIGNTVGVDVQPFGTFSEAGEAIVEVMNSGSAADAAEGGDEGEAADEAWTPTVGQKVLYKPAGAKTATTHEIISVLKTTLGLKKSKDGVISKGIKFDATAKTIDGKPLQLVD